MKVYKVKALKFPERDRFDPQDEPQYIIQKFNNIYSIWEDWYGEFEDGEDPTSSVLSIVDFTSLEEVREILEHKEYIEKGTEFIDIER